MIESNKIGIKITEARKKVNISQAQLGERLFISPQAVGKWERGESLPDIITLNRLAEILGVDLNYFSENFQVTTNERTSFESRDKEPAESVNNPIQTAEQNLPTGKTGKKLSWDMSRGNWTDADFSGLKDLNEKFSSSNMQRCLFIGSELSGLLLKGNNVENCDFSGSNISNSRIQGSNLLRNKFKGCSLKESEFSGSNIERCDFSDTNFSGTQFSKSFLFGCNFTAADFSGVVIKSGGFSGVKLKKDEPEKNEISNAVWNHTSFINSHIADIVFTGTMKDCYFENCDFTRVIFRNATLINTFFKNNSNLKRIRFIDCKADRMTLEFLKQGKADLTGITLLTPE